MSPLRSFTGWLFVALAGACAGPATSTAPAEEVRVELVCEAPMSIPDFLRFAQRQTGRIYTYDARAVEGVEVSWIGVLWCERGRLDGFVETMLRLRGFALQRRQQGDLGVLEVVRIEPGKPTS
jgi:hypothetical protein